MPHSCELCGTELGPRDRVCTVCGKKVGEAESVGVYGANTGAPSSAPDGTASNAPLIMPQALAPSRNRQGAAWMLFRVVTAATVVGAACWLASILWRIGPGGEIAFQQHNSAGNSAFERGDFNTADAEYSAMVAVRPRRIDGYLLRAINDYRMGLFPQAIRDNTSALALNPAMMQRGGLYFNRAEAYSGRKAWDKAIADYTASEQAYEQAGAEQGGYERDRERLPRWLADVRHGRARANLQLKNYAQTVADYSANIKAGTFLPEDYGMRATAEAGLGKEAEAAADYGKSICVDAGYLYGYQCLDRMVTRSHRYEQAVSAYRQATEAHPENVLCWGSLGSFEHLAGDLPAAIAADEKALSLDPNQTWIRYNMGLTYAVAGDTDRARKTYAAALADQDQSSRAGSFNELQKAQLEHPGSPALQAAVKQMETAIAGNPTPPAAAAGRASALPVPRVAPAFESLLAASTTLHDYAIRPPAGYTLKQTKSVNLSGGQHVDYWQGTVRPDGSVPVLQVEVINDDGRLAAHSNAKQIMQEYLDEVASNHTQLKVSAITPCTLGLRTFMKATWSGIGTKTGKPFNGIVYISSQTGERISMVAHDSASYSATSLPLLEASLCTFRK